jgi:DNA-binding GntR family transcriptional regulator
VSRPAVTTAVDAVAQELRAAVLAGSPAPGERLREEALAARFEVARHTLRAALRALAAERLVVVEPHRGARVARLDAAELRALFELRTALEVEAAHLAATRTAAPDRWAPEVEAAAAELDRRCRARPADRAAVDAAHLALHHALVAAAGSPRITEAHAALAVEHRLALLQSRDTLPVDRMAEHHRELLERLRSDGPAALRRHLEEGRILSEPG